jgi:HAD superfamily hydrolase (TIGR01662 family)
MNNRKAQAILFDLGNTLVHFDAPWPDTFQEMANALLQSLKKAGISIEEENRFSQDFYQRLIVNEPQPENEYKQVSATHNLMELLMGYGFWEPDQRVVNHALRQMFEIAEKYWTVEDDTIQTLLALKSHGYRLAIISNAEDSENVQQIINKAKIKDLFEVIIDSASYGFAKPGSAIFNEVLGKMHISPLNSVMVGDRLDTDILGANQINIRSVWITRRSRFSGKPLPHESMKPWKTIDSLTALLQILE